MSQIKVILRMGNSIKELNLTQEQANIPYIRTEAAKLFQIEPFEDCIVRSGTKTVKDEYKWDLTQEKCFVIAKAKHIEEQEDTESSSEESEEVFEQTNDSEYTGSSTSTSSSSDSSMSSDNSGSSSSSHYSNESSD